MTSEFPPGRSRFCERPNCYMEHGWYPNMEHELLELSDEEFRQRSDVLFQITGLRLTRKMEEKS